MNMYTDTKTREERMKLKQRSMPYWVKDILVGVRITVGVGFGLAILWIFVVLFQLFF